MSLETAARTNRGGCGPPGTANRLTLEIGASEQAAALASRTTDNRTTASLRKFRKLGTPTRPRVCDVSTNRTLTLTLSRRRERGSDHDQPLRWDGVINEAEGARPMIGIVKSSRLVCLAIAIAGCGSNGGGSPGAGGSGGGAIGGAAGGAIGGATGGAVGSRDRRRGGRCRGWRGGRGERIGRRGRVGLGRTGRHEIHLQSFFNDPYDIVAGPDGNLWFGEADSFQVGRVTPAGTIMEFPVPSTAAKIGAITAGPDGNLWFIQSNPTQVGRITPAGAITMFAVNGSPVTSPRAATAPSGFPSRRSAPSPASRASASPRPSPFRRSPALRPA